MAFVGPTPGGSYRHCNRPPSRQLCRAVKLDGVCRSPSQTDMSCLHPIRSGQSTHRGRGQVRRGTAAGAAARARTRVRWHRHWWGCSKQGCEARALLCQGPQPPRLPELTFLHSSTGIEEGVVEKLICRSKRGRCEGPALSLSPTTQLQTTLEE